MFISHQKPDLVERQKNYLKTIGIDIARIIDIHYPAKSIIAILVHKMYAEEFTTTMMNAGIKPNTKFNPLDPACYETHPALRNMTDEQKQAITIEKHNQRLVRALPFMRKSCSKAVAQFFYQEKLISEAQLMDFLEMVNTATNKHYKKDYHNTKKDDTMETTQPINDTTEMEVVVDVTNEQQLQ